MTDSGASTPHASRFTSQAHAAEDRLKADTVGLVQLSDFRKRRVEAFEAAQDAASTGQAHNGPDSIAKATAKKRKKIVKKGGLSFDDQEDEDGTPAIDSANSKATISKDAPSKTGLTDNADTSQATIAKKHTIKPNSSVKFQPKAMTKTALLREEQLKEALKREYTQLQEAVKATEIVIPFVFYDGKNIPGGACRVKKGDFIWLFLDRARKVGAELVGQGDGARKDWARISVDDLMLVKGDLIIPHHYDIHYFIVDGKIGYHGPIFPYSGSPTATTPQHLLPNYAGETASQPVTTAGLVTAEQRAAQAATVTITRPSDSELEGFDDDPSLTKVVDRRWYERHKHVFPASAWEEFDPEKDYTTTVRKDANGNAMFFSR